MNPNAPDYDARKYVLIRDWVNEHNYEIDEVFHYLRTKGADILEVKNPYADALGKHFDKNGLSESFSPTMRALRIEQESLLDDYATETGPRAIKTDITVKFQQDDDDYYIVDTYDPGVDDYDVWYINRPAEITMNQPVQEVSTKDFRFPPPIILDGDTLTIYGLKKIMEVALTINGVEFGPVAAHQRMPDGRTVEIQVSRFQESRDSGRSKLPGGFRWGKFETTVSAEEKEGLLK